MCANVSSYDRAAPEVRYLPSALLPPQEEGLDSGLAISRKRHSQDETENGLGISNKRAARSPEIMFRLLIPSTKIGKVIGKQGSQIKLLRDETGARIKIADPVSAGEERVVLISSKDEVGEGSTSAAEDALIRVATVMIEEGTDADRAASIGPQHHISPNMTRLLIAGSQAGSLIGKQGATIKELREASGATVRILAPDQLPVCSSAMENDRLVQVAGDLSQVQKALGLIGAKLRENPPKDSGSIRANFYPPSTNMVVPQGVMTGYQGAGRNRVQGGNVRTDPFGRLSGNGAPPAGFPAPDNRGLPKISTEIRILSGLMGGVIGRGGSNISQIRSISGASVKVSGQDGSSERTVTIEGTPDQVTTAQSLVQAFLSAQSTDLLPALKILGDQVSSQASYP